MIIINKNNDNNNDDNNNTNNDNNDNDNKGVQAPDLSTAALFGTTIP